MPCGTTVWPGSGLSLVAAWLVQKHDVLAVSDPGVTEPDSHPPTQRLSEQQPLR